MNGRVDGGVDGWMNDSHFLYISLENRKISSKIYSKHGVGVMF